MPSRPRTLAHPVGALLVEGGAQRMFEIFETGLADCTILSFGFTGLSLINIFIAEMLLNHK